MVDRVLLTTAFVVGLEVEVLLSKVPSSQHGLSLGHSGHYNEERIDPVVSVVEAPNKPWRQLRTIYRKFEVKV
jgi:hypothetical protein